MMSHSSVREDIAQRKSMNECSEIKLTSAGGGGGGIRRNEYKKKLGKRYLSVGQIANSGALQPSTG